MRALLWNGDALRFVRDAEPPAPTHDSALVRVALAGICSTDLQILRGYMGFRGILGHEFVGRVSDGSPAWMGKRVVGEINFSCRRCPTCLAGRPRHCPSRTVMGILGADGAFSEWVRVPLANLHEVPAGLDDEEAVFVEPLAAAIEAEEQSRNFAGGRTAVVGSGKLGLLVAQALRERGDRVVVVYRSLRSRSRAEALGLAVAAQDDLPRGCDLVVEASGATEGLKLAFAIVRPCGAVVLKSSLAERYILDLSPVVINEIVIIGSRCGRFPPALAALTERRVVVRGLIDAVLPLEEGVEATRRASVPGAGKVLLDVRET